MVSLRRVASGNEKRCELYAGAVSTKIETIVPSRGHYVKQPENRSNYSSHRAIFNTPPSLMKRINCFLFHLLQCHFELHQLFN